MLAVCTLHRKRNKRGNKEKERRKQRKRKQKEKWHEKGGGVDVKEQNVRRGRGEEKGLGGGATTMTCDRERREERATCGAL